jgi:TonB-linked SusC/RagA family outer membrane protein
MESKAYTRTKHPTSSQEVYGSVSRLKRLFATLIWVLGLSLLLFSPARAQEAAGNTITGTVTDSSSGKPLPGVNVLVKGSTSGTATNADGEYELPVESLQDTLVFSFVGYETPRVPINGRTEINVQLHPQTITGEEIVVVGYGEEREVNVTGSVSSIDEAAIQEIPVTQASQALAGQASGVSVRQAAGAPGEGSAKVRIRGYGTFSRAGNNPLVIVDGIPSSLDNVAPNNIASISVLKDAASAAIYGSRAANGVILVETKRGREGELSVSYSAYVGMQEPTQTPEFVDSWIYAQAKNEASTNMGQGRLYTEEDIQKYRTGASGYPNMEHYRKFFNSGNGMQARQSLQITGGSSNTQYLASLSYLRKNGLVRENWYNRYNLRFNIDSDVTDRLKFRLNVSGNVSDEREPGAFTGDGTLERLVTRITRQNATQPVQTSEGWYSHIDRGAPWAALASKNFVQDEGTHFLGNTNFTYSILNSLEVIARAGYEINYSKYRKFRSRFRVDPNLLQKPARLGINLGNSKTLTLEGILKYSKSLQAHEINLTGGYSQISSRSEGSYAYRDNFPNNNLHQLAAASSSNMVSNSNASEWALRSAFGRLEYSYDNRYLFETSARYDGSSRFREGNRYGFFPSFSVGWIISNEQFFENKLPWVSNMKLRVSWGELGNQQIGNYPYQSTYNMGQDYVFGNSVSTGAAITELANRNISWETTKVSDVGLDISVLNDRISLTADYFHKKTEDILYPLTVANVLGMGGSVQNAGEVLNEGWEFSLSFENSSNDFSYSISPNFSITNTEVLNLSNVEKDIGQQLFIGQPLNAIYGYVDDGLFVDEQDIQNYPDQPYAPQPGDIRYKDISGPNGTPDGKVTAEHDRKVIGQTSPKYTYGAQFSGSYSNFDLTLQLQGAGGMKRAPEHYAARAFANGSNLQQWMWENRWTEENPDRDAIYPRLLIHGEARNQPYSWPSTYWFWDASFVRLKFAQVGYDFSSGVLNSLNLDQLRLYVSGRNLYTIDDFVPGWDPELQVRSAGGGKHYPLSRIFNLGVNIRF